MNNESKNVLNKRICANLVCVSCSWRCPGTSSLNAYLAVSLILCSSGINAQGEPRALEGHCVSSKHLSRVRDGEEEIAGRNKREKYFPKEGSLICLEDKSIIFYLTGLLNI